MHLNEYNRAVPVAIDVAGCLFVSCAGTSGVVWSEDEEDEVLVK